MLRGDGEARALGDLPGRSRQGQGHSIECRTAGFELAECGGDVPGRAPWPDSGLRVSLSDSYTTMSHVPCCEEECL